MKKKAVFTSHNTQSCTINLLSAGLIKYTLPNLPAFINGRLFISALLVLQNTANPHQVQQSSMNLWWPQETGVLIHLLNLTRSVLSIGNLCENKDNAEHRSRVSMASCGLGHFVPSAWLNKEGVFLGIWVTLGGDGPHGSSHMLLRVLGKYTLGDPIPGHWMWEDGGSHL